MGCPSDGLTLLIPAYNEETAVRSGRLAEALAWLTAQPGRTELIVIDDGSSDRTAELAARWASRVLTVPHGGKAYALISGIRVASCRRLLFSDMDQSSPPGEAARLLSALDEGVDVAVGSRGWVRPGAPPCRCLLSGGHAVLRRALTGLGVRDSQCGLKAFTAAAAADILDHLVVYGPDRPRSIVRPSVTSGFDVEFLLVALRLGYTVREVPVAWHYRRARHVNLARDSFRGAGDLLAIAANLVRGRYPARRPPGRRC